MAIMKPANRVLLILLKDFSRIHTITSIAKELNLSRVGIWKILKKLEADDYITLQSVGSGKTSISMIKINWDNILVEKAIGLYLTEEALTQRRWRANFAELENEVDFVILYGSILHSPKQANDVDIIGVVSGSRRFLGISEFINKVQKTQMKKIHSLMFGKEELIKELKKPNKVFVDAIKKGVVLFGQEKFVKFMMGVVK